MKLRTIAACAVVLSGCSQTADQIKPTTVSVAPFQTKTCAELAAENAQVSAQLADLSARQEKAAENDKTAFVMGGLLAASIVGEDHTKEIASLKGRSEAIQSARATKGCS